MYTDLHVNDVLRPGEDRARTHRQTSPFMEKVFSLAPNEAAVSANLPETEIYVVRAL